MPQERRRWWSWSGGLGEGGVRSVFISVVAIGFYFEGQVFAAGLDDSAIDQDVDPVGDDVVEDSLVVGDQRGARYRRFAGR